MSKGNASCARYGHNVTATAAASRCGWETSGAEDKYACWNISMAGTGTGTGTDTGGSDDYRQDWLTQGFMVEIDPYNACPMVKGRTAPGRFAHEDGAFGLPQADKPLAACMGRDSQSEYVPKFVSPALKADLEARFTAG